MADIIYTLKLSSGKELKLTSEELAELKEEFTQYVQAPMPWPVFPNIPYDPGYPTYEPYPHYPGHITCVT